MKHYKTLLSWFQRGIALVALFGMLMPAMAQMTVDDFYYDRTDQRPTRAEYQVKDQDGYYCAIIKVVTSENDFTFSGNEKTQRVGGEIFVWVPKGLRVLGISHPRFGSLDYDIPEALRESAAYTLLLNPGGGRYVNITSSGAAKARVAIDNQYVGETPIYNYFMPFGSRRVKGTVGRFEADTLFSVQAGEGRMSLDLNMQDQSHHFGEVEVTVPGNAEIYFQGQKVGNGRWKESLREGRYEVTTKKEDCEPATTSFTVKPRVLNQITAEAPVPHTGSIQLYTRPRSATATCDGKPIDLTESHVLPIGKHQFNFVKKGYVTLDKEFSITRNTLTADTVIMEPINYLKSKWAFYFGAGYSLNIGSLSGVTGYLGAVFKNIDLQLSYTLGLGKSDEVNWYTKVGVNDMWQNTMTYKMSAMAARLGYQIRLIPKLGITPQVGVMQQFLSGSISEGNAASKFADGAKATSFTVGAKVLAVPVHHLYIFLTPEYAIPISKDATFTKAADAADFSAGGLSISAGIIVNFGK